MCPITHQWSARRERVLERLCAARGSGAALIVDAGSEVLVAKSGVQSGFGGVRAGPGHGRDLSAALSPLPDIEDGRVHLELADGLERNRRRTAVGFTAAQQVARLRPINAQVGAGPALPAQRQLIARQGTQRRESREIAILNRERVDLLSRDTRAAADARLATGLCLRVHGHFGQLHPHGTEHEIDECTRTDGH